MGNNENTKCIAVMAGTPVDTGMGADLLKSRVQGVRVISLPVSETPEEQTEFQHLDLEMRTAVIREMIVSAMEQGAESLLVYCNSLSAAVDFVSLSTELGLPVATPLGAYEELGRNHNLLAAMAANNQSLSGIERAVMRHNPGARLIGCALLPAVEDIEAGVSPQEIVGKYRFKDLCAFYEGTGCQAIILGCTHFPWFKAELQALTSLEVIDPADYMLSLIL